MSGWIYAAIAVLVVVVLALVALSLTRQRRTRGLRERFGPEYDRTKEAAGGRRDAEAELLERERRRSDLEIRPLSEEARRRYADEWRSVQSQFVDAPVAALSAADGLVTAVMNDRGYPVDDFERQASDLSVDHPGLVENYRSAHRVAVSVDSATTEDRRRAMQRYRTLFDELLGASETAPSEHAVAAR